MDLFYRQYGEGYPLIILHGLYGSSDNWLGIAKELSQDYRVILPDQRNHGQSPQHPDHSYDSLSNDIFELTENLGIDRFILAGHSMGGKAASYFAKKWPEKLTGLLVIDITPFSQPEQTNLSNSIHYRILDSMKKADLKTIHSREDANKIFSDVLQSERIIKFLLKNLKRKQDGGFQWKLNPGNLLNNIENIYDGLSKENSGENIIRGFPVFFLRALGSDYISDEDYEDIMRHFPAAEIIEVPDSSHWIHAEKPEILIDLIRENFPV